MQLKRRVSLQPLYGSRRQLDELDDRIIITGIDEAAGKDSLNTVSVAYRDGQRLTGSRRDTLDVTVKFAINLKNDRMTAREHVLENVLAWAADGGWLRLNYRPGRRLLVVLAQAPGAGDLFNWTNEFTMVFRAVSLPYWTDDSTEEKDLVPSSSKNGIRSADGKTFYLDVPGNTKTTVDLTMKNSSGKKINRISLKVGGDEMLFDFPADKALGAGETLVVDHVHNQGAYYLRARIGTDTISPSGSHSLANARSALAWRSGVDDFLTTPGKTRIDFSAKDGSTDRGVAVNAMCRGRYL